MQAKSSGITLPEVHRVDKGIDPNILLEKQDINPIISSEMKGVTQNKPRLGQGRAGIKQKIKPSTTPLQLQNIVQPKAALKVSVPKSSRPHDNFFPVSNYIISQTNLEMI